MSIETALRTELLSNTAISTLVGSRVYVGDAPYTFTYPFIRVVSAGDNPDNYNIKNRKIETFTIDIFASHNPQLGVFGYDVVTKIAELIREQFDAFLPEKWGIYDIITCEYRGFSVLKNTDSKDIMKPVTLTITYNI